MAPEKSPILNLPTSSLNDVGTCHSNISGEGEKLEGMSLPLSKTIFDNFDKTDGVNEHSPDLHPV
jgi:hypothetical protein